MLNTNGLSALNGWETFFPLFYAQKSCLTCPSAPTACPQIRQFSMMRQCCRDLCVGRTKRAPFRETTRASSGIEQKGNERKWSILQTRNSKHITNIVETQEKSTEEDNWDPFGPELTQFFIQKCQKWDRFIMKRILIVVRVVVRHHHLHLLWFTKILAHTHNAELGKI